MFPMWNIEMMQSVATSQQRSQQQHIPQNFDLPPGTANLLYEMNKVLLFWLRDGRTFVGTLRSLDQYGNVVLSDTIERIYVGLEYADIQHGICILRGETLILVGEWDPEKERRSGTHQRELDYILGRQMEEGAKKTKDKELHQKAMRERGLTVREDPEDDFYVK